MYDMLEFFTIPSSDVARPQSYKTKTTFSRPRPLF